MVVNNTLRPPDIRTAIARCPLTIAPSATVLDAVLLLSQAHSSCDVTESAPTDPTSIDLRSLDTTSADSVSCILVVEQQQVIGIVTERDIVRLGGQQRSLDQLTVRQAMSHPVITYRETDLIDFFSIVQWLQQQQIRHLPIVDENDRLTGLITTESLRMIARPVDLLRLRLVEDVMKREVICEIPQTSLLAIAQLMTHHRVSSVVIVEDADGRDRPVGILTERDMVQFQALGLALADYSAATVMSTPLFTVRPTESLWTIQQLMDQRCIRRVVVTTTDNRLLGIMTQSTILQALNPVELLHLVDVLEQQVKRLEAEKIVLLERQTERLQQDVEHHQVSLRSSEDRFRTIFNNAFQFMGLLTPEGTVLELNNTLMQAVGLSYGDVLEQPIWAIPIWQSDSMSSAELQAAIAHARSGQSIRRMVQLIGPNHRVIPIDFSLRPMVGDRGQVTLIILEGRDLTETQQLELECVQALERLRMSERRYANLLETAPVGIAHCDIEGRCTYANDCYCQIMGLTTEQAVQDGWKHHLHPADREWVMEAWAHAIAEKQEIQIECRCVVHNQTRWVIWQSTPEYDEHGHVSGLVGTLIDISDRKQIESSRREYTQQLEQQVSDQTILLKEAQQIARMGNWSWNLETNERWWSPQLYALMGFDPAEYEHPPSLEIVTQKIHPADQTRVHHAVTIALEEGQPLEIEFRVFQDDQIRYVFSKGVVDRDNNGRLLRFWGIAQDITDRKQTELALQASEQRLSDILDSAIASIASFQIYPEKLFTYQYWSAGCEQVFGYPPQAFIDNPEFWMSRVHPDDADCLICRMDFQQLAETSRIQEYRFYDAENRLRWIQSYLASRRDEENDCWVVTALDVDITDRKQAELALSASEQRLNDILDSAIASIASFQLYSDRSFTYQYWSAGCEHVFGYPAQIFIDDPEFWLSRIHPEDRDAIVSEMENFIYTEIAHTREYRFYDAEDNLRWIRSSLTSRRDDENNCWVVTALDLDITDRKQAELALQASEQRFSDILDSTIASIAIFQYYEDQPIVYNYWSAGSEYVFGYPTEAFLNNSQLWFSRVHPDDQQIIIDHRSLIYSETPHYREYRFYDANNQIRWIRSWLTSRRDDENNCWIVTALDLDISDRKQAEIALQISEQRFQEIVSTISQLFLVRSAKTGQFIYVSPAYEKIWGRSCDSLYANPDSWQDAIHPDDRAQLRQSLHQQFQGQPVTRDYRIIRPDGEIRWIFAQLTPLLDEQGELDRWIGSATDITVNKLAEQELLQARAAAESANEAKNIFIANMSHELRSPLNAILGFAHLLHRDQSLSVEQRERAKTIERSGQHLLSIINQVLDLARIEANHATLDISTVDTWSLLNDLKELFILRANEKGLELRIERSPNFPHYIDTDAMKLRQVLINLLDNAIKFTDRGSIRLYADGRPLHDCELDPPPHDDGPLFYVCFYVEDTGCGIAPDDQALLFEAFQQTTAGRQIQGGTGLGLTISQKFVRLMGGELIVNSQLGQGSRFDFCIQGRSRQNQATPPLLNPSSVVGLQPGQTAYRFLIVDDNLVNCRLLVGQLSILGVETQIAANGEQAIQHYLDWQPDVIFMDLRMPLMDGYEATRQIRNYEAQQSCDRPVIIIAVSATGMTDHRRVAIPAGCNEFIQKPIAEAELFHVLQQTLNLRYRYEDNGDPAIDTRFWQGLRDQLETLSDSELEQLEEALIVGNESVILLMADAVAGGNVNLYQSLKTVTERLDYLPLLEMITAIRMERSIL